MIKEYIGKGTYACVHAYGEDRVIKKYHNVNTHLNSISEIDITLHLDCENLLQGEYNSKLKAIILPKKKGNFNAFIKYYSCHPKIYQIGMILFKDLCNAVVGLSKYGYMTFDIKAENILYDFQPDVDGEIDLDTLKFYMIDHGLAIPYLGPGYKHETYNLLASPHVVAPESQQFNISKSVFCLQSSLWSIALVVSRLFVAYPCNSEKIYLRYLNEEEFPLIRHLNFMRSDEKIISILSEIFMHKDPDLRPDIRSFCDPLILYDEKKCVVTSFLKENPDLLRIFYFYLKKKFSSYDTQYLCYTVSLFIRTMTFWPSNIQEYYLALVYIVTYYFKIEKSYFNIYVSPSSNIENLIFDILDSIQYQVSTNPFWEMENPIQVLELIETDTQTFISLFD